jgi:hypothetical protein
MKAFTLIVIGVGQALAESEIPKSGGFCVASYGGNTKIGANPWLLNPKVMSRFIPLGEDLIYIGNTKPREDGSYPSSTVTEAVTLFGAVERLARKLGYEFGETPSIVNGISENAMSRKDENGVVVPLAPMMSQLVVNLREEV